MDLLWTDFVNSEWHDWRGSGRSEDRLEKPAWLEQFLATWQLSAAIPPEPAELSLLKSVRGSLRRMAESLVAGIPLSADDLEFLNELMAGGPVTRRIADGTHPQVQLVPLQHNWAQVKAEVAAAFVQTLTTGETGRVRICENKDCLWVFYDDTRNRSKRFCDDKVCGNLMKVRRFRARNKVE